jgi:membrane protein implicated in regulation of membrane protease activity
MAFNHSGEVPLPEGIVDSVVRPNHEWRVRVYGVYWSALSKKPLQLCPGDRVWVIGREKTKLLITAKRS